MRTSISAVVLQVYAVYDPRRVFSIMSDARTQLFRKYQRQLIPPVLRKLLCFVHSSSLNLVRRPTSILRYEWCQKSTFQKLLKTIYTSLVRLRSINIVTGRIKSPIFACGLFSICWLSLVVAPSKLFIVSAKLNKNVFNHLHKFKMAAEVFKI